MKNFYTLVSALLICGGAFAQGTAVNMQAAPKKLIDTNIPTVVNQTETYTLRSSVDCSTSTALYCEDFEATDLAPDLPGDLSTTSLESGYVIPLADGSTANVDGFFTGDATDAGAGGYWTYLDEHTTFAMTNDDSCLPSGAVPNANNNCDLSFETLALPSLDFTSESGQWLMFDFYHDMNWGGGDAFVEASIDGGTTWEMLNGGQLPATQAWQTGAFDLSQLEGQASVTIRFTWSDNGTWASGLAVDNITVEPLAEYAMTMIDNFQLFPSSYFGGTAYRTVPLAQAEATAYNFGGYLKNMGLNALDSGRIHASIATEGFSTTSWGANTASLAQDTFYCNDVFTPSATGQFTVEIYGADENGTTTPTESIDFIVSDYDYARDAADFTGGYTGGSYINDAGSEERGNVYDIYADGMIYAIKAAVHPATSPNTMAKAVLNSVNPEDGEVTYLTETQEIAVGDLATGDWINFMFDSPIPIAAGDVLLATISATFNGMDTLILATSGNSAPGETLLQDIDGVSGDAGTWYYTTNTVMVRLNFDEDAEGPTSSGVEELNLSNFNLYPNPNNGEFTMNIMTKEATDFTMTINNIIGQTVSSEELENVTALSKNINLTGLGKGVYFVTLSGKNGTMTQRVAVK
jgi:hypothetical protein